MITVNRLIINSCLQYSQIYPRVLNENYKLIASNVYANQNRLSMVFHYNLVLLYKFQIILVHIYRGFFIDRHNFVIDLLESLTISVLLEC